MSGTIRAAILGAAFLFISTAQAAIVVDLTTSGSKGSINGAIFHQFSPQPTGTGVLNTFLRIQADGVEQGYNTDFRKIDLNQLPDIYTRSLPLSEVPKVTIDGVLYREFLLDINESNNTSLLSLNDVQLFLASDPALIGYANLGTPIYKMDAGANNSVKLDYSLNSGSGSGDMVMYVPDANFDPTSGQFVYLFSRFGQPIPSDDADVTSDAGFEEWSAGKRGPRGTIVPITVPEPSSMSLLMIAGTALLRRGRR
ncbi:MAG TPA: PEP-CTERM sorting domain-containing protein [Tepidisphaeraceae bacterium]|jgi:hypothetical protein|nr:PEP-CTERM sorting domain-containing protein [Tepidisphaeraceae bacterium]